MRKLFIFNILFFLSINGKCQKVFFKSPSYTDSSELSLVISSLAKQIVKFSYFENSEKKFDNLFRLQILLKDYEQARSSLDSLCILYQNKGIGFPFRIFIESMIRNKKGNVPFNNSFEKTFIELFSSLNQIEEETAIESFDYDIKVLHDRFKNKIGQLKNDSISYEDALAICRSYNSYKIYSQILPLGKKILMVIDSSRYIIENNTVIKMRDGSLITLNIARERNAPLPLPVILNFNIYAGQSDITDAKSIARRGYVGVVANTRGKQLSPNDIEPFEHDANDAFDIINWISKQSWCNGKVGMFGASYLGFSQWAAVKNIHPALKTIVPQVSVGAGIDFPMNNGIFRSYMLRWIHYVCNGKQTDDNKFTNKKYWNSLYNKWYTGGDSFRDLDTLEGKKSIIYQRWLQHPNFDIYWQNSIPYKKEFANINIPILTITGYFDDDQLGALYYYNEHIKFNKKANHTLFIGPYTHSGAQGSPLIDLDGYKIAPVANINISNLVYKWLDYVLKDSLKPEILKDKVNVQVMGTNTWKHASSLAHTCNDTLRFYFSNVHAGNHFKLLTKKPTEKEFIRQEVDYLDRSDTTEISDEKVVAREMEKGEYISFITEPMDTTITINGTFTGELKSIINKKDMDLTIRLYEQLPDGRYFNLSHFLGRASYAKDRSKRQLLSPGKLETIPYTNSFFTSKRLTKGSRLVVLVGINKNKYWQVNYGTGKDVSDESIQDGKVPLQIQWFNDSYINVPIWKEK